VSSVVNRCRPPGSFDIMVPFGDVSIFGTTSRDVQDPGALGVDADEEVELRAGAEEFLREPAALEASQSSTFAGVRPLAVTAPGSDGAVSRRHVVIADTDSPVFTVVGGSFTTHRAMAEDVVDQACARLRVNATCTTAETPLAPAQGLFSWSREAVLEPGLLSAGTRP